MAKTYEERLAALIQEQAKPVDEERLAALIQEQAKPVELPRFELMGGLGYRLAPNEEQNLLLSVQFHGPDAQLYEVAISPGEAYVLLVYLQDQLKYTRSWGNPEENLKKINEYLQENYGLKFPY